MKTKGLYSIEEFLKLKSAKDICISFTGDISNVSTFEIEIRNKFGKHVDITMKDESIQIKTKDCLLEEIKSIACSHGLSMVTK